jgi:hypothetical protein
MTRNPDQRQVDSGVKQGQTELPDRSGRLTEHTREPMKGEPVKQAHPDTRPKDPRKPRGP